MKVLTVKIVDIGSNRDLCAGSHKVDFVNVSWFMHVYGIPLHEEDDTISYGTYINQAWAKFRLKKDKTVAG